MVPDKAAHPSLTRLLLTALIVAPGAAASDDIWHLQIREQDISVYTRVVEGSPFPEVKATTVIDAPLVRVAALLGDGNGCVEWRALCESSRVIETVSDRERYVYLVLDIPWPAKDRDMVVHSTATIDELSRSVTVDLKAASSHHPQGDYIRAESNGQFILREISREQVEFTYTMHTDLGGNLPAGPVNTRLAGATLDDLSRLRELAEK